MAKAPKTGLFSYSNLVHAIAGGCGSAVAMSVLFPLDTVRTRLQLEEGRTSRNTFFIMAEVYKQEGLAGLYRGLLPVIESLYCSNFVYFYTFHGLKRIANEDKAALRDLLLAMVAGSINVMTTNPLWVVNTRLKMQGAKVHNSQHAASRKYKGLLDGLAHVGREEGLAGLWSGATSSLILTVNPAIQFMAYEAMKRQMQTVYNSQQLNSLVVFGVGAAAKALATVLTYPIQLVQAKQRHGHNYEGVPQKAGLITIMMYIIRKYGFRGLFKGLEAKILQTVLTAALMFVCYEKIAGFVFAILVGNRKTVMKQ
ncbi:peroxisomal membrane protein PMP34-like [Homarus americanus]|uniref:peroxisomal membrane protein PMP34-like n=1 Tax=Homarus americanus TaxID=6706 RepID=UPI001C473CB2|nr:peroxisomal membrane protein PMP34-like [Homarus americanus]